jgi:hypothetical protein
MCAVSIFLVQTRAFQPVGFNSYRQRKAHFNGGLEVNMSSHCSWKVDLYTKI